MIFDFACAKAQSSHQHSGMACGHNCGVGQWEFSPWSLLEDLKTLKSLSSSPEFLVPTQEVWVGAQEFTFLTNTQVGLRLLL